MKTNNSSNNLSQLSENKRLLRGQMLSLRKEFLQHGWSEASLAAQRHILNLPAWRHARQVLLYAAVRGELDTGLLFAHAIEAGKQVLFPRCIAPVVGDSCGRMELAFCAGHHQLIPGSYQIPEPDPAVCPGVETVDLALDLALIPGVAFSRTGERLGYGGGYYDRFFADNRSSGCIFIGFCASFQLLDSLPSAEWDVKVDAVCTENGVILI